jgi:hypothetical protein
MPGARRRGLMEVIMEQIQTFAPAAFGRKPLSPRRSLDPIFSPKNIAVIGATETPNSVGRTALWNLIAAPFGGTVFPVNPRRASVLGIKAYPNIAGGPGKSGYGRGGYARAVGAVDHRTVR